MAMPDLQRYPLNIWLINNRRNQKTLRVYLSNSVRIALNESVR